MRLPTSVLARVRGPIAVIALVGCSGASDQASVPAPAPAPSAVPPVAIAPDPVAYDDAGEAARLARIDEHDASAAEVRAARMDHVASLERARTDRLVERALLGSDPDVLDPSGIGHPYGRTACLACGRG